MSEAGRGKRENKKYAAHIQERPHSNPTVTGPAQPVTPAEMTQGPTALHCAVSGYPNPPGRQFPYLAGKNAGYWKYCQCKSTVALRYVNG
eukprot:1160707-Pelagomonas_calceolata.AAC.2